MVDASGLSLTALAFRDLFSKIEHLDHVFIGTPKLAVDTSLPTETNLNLFFYKVDYYGYPADSASGDPAYMKMYCLVTPVSGTDPTNTVSPGESDLRVVGWAAQLVHAYPILEVADPYLSANIVAQIQVTPHALTLDDINHLWGSQNWLTAPTLPYRLSIAFELALVPLPTTAPVPSGPLVTSVHSTVGRSDLTAASASPDGNRVVVSPQVARTVVATQSADWVPAICFVDGAGNLSNSLTLSPTTTADALQSLGIVVAGAAGSHVTLVWQKWDPASAPAGTADPSGWQAGGSQAVTIPSPSGPTDSMDPTVIDPARLDPRQKQALVLPFVLPATDPKYSAQGIVYASRMAQRPGDSSAYEVRSNILVVGVHS